MASSMHSCKSALVLRLGSEILYLQRLVGFCQSKYSSDPVRKDADPAGPLTGDGRERVAEMTCPRSFYHS